MTAPIDLDHLDKYVLGDSALRDEILTIFIDQAGILIGRLQAAADDDEGFRIAAHTLKGAARGIGAWALGDLAEAAEKIMGAERALRPAAIGRIEGAANSAIVYARGLRERAA